ncbi:hypothetical protein FXO38_08571 [Capsicum annuum]|uniref:FAF domain-containing protein n=1 Tax=Capsicum annuum TaxID=4072 RepID=A0A2G3AHE2_CAPAN|nr:hypothetical protein FXO38_08571 [Capsicum annuum]KAF3670702.1 hypothetical protein FXO37_08420 [Capsicum annuum]PHT93661.1 hypothetical protein T459_01543 [Capsicum annuum]
MGSTSILHQGLQSCMEPQLPQQHFLISKWCLPRLIDLSQSTLNTSTNLKKTEAGNDGLSEQHSNVDNSIGGWSFIKDLSNPKKDYYYDEKEEYVHPMVKRSSTSLSIKSLGICTESLGSETGSYMSENIEEHSFNLSESENSHLAPRSKCRKIGKKHDKISNFPPPMPSLSRTNGFQVMRPHREGGRLILKATTISVPKSYFKAERIDGRLRLSLLNNTEVDEAREDEHENVDESDDGDIKLVSENGYVRPSKCKENGSRIKAYQVGRHFGCPYLKC